MYESQVRPQIKGRKLVVPQHPGSRLYINAFQSLALLSNFHLDYRLPGDSPRFACCQVAWQFSPVVGV